MKKKILSLLLAGAIVQITCSNIFSNELGSNLFGGYQTAVAENVVTNLETKFICEELGQAFFGKTVDFDYQIKNTTGLQRQFEVRTILKNDLGTVEFDKTDIVDLMTDESVTINYSMELSRYGYYDVDITVTETESQTSKEYSTQITVIKKSEIQNPKMGICDHTALFGDGYKRVEEKMEFLKKSGISAIRDMAQWVDWEKTPDVYEMPEKYETVFEAAKKNNLDVFLINGMHNYLVAPNERPPESAEGIAAFGRYTYHMVEDTAKYSSGYEVYNEWNVPTFNTNELPAEAYIPLIKEAYTQIKSANPEAKVYGLSGLCLTRGLSPWADVMFENGVADYCDGFSIHPYCHTESPDEGTSVEAVQYILDLMKKYGAEDKPLILTEMGWQATSWPKEKIASWIVKYMSMTHDIVDKIYWYNSQRKVNQVEAEMSFGWMQDADESKDYVPYAPLEQYLAAANYNSHMAKATSEGKIENADGDVVMYKYKQYNGQTAIIAWVKDGCGSKTVEVQIDNDKVEIEDLFGNAQEYAVEDGKIEVLLTEEPQYIVYGDAMYIGEPRVRVINTNDSVVLEGSLGLENENLTLFIEKDSKIQYMNQIKTDARGRFNVSIPIDKEYGVYNFTIGTKDNGKTPLSFEFDVELFEMSVSKDGKKIEKFDDVSIGDKLQINLKKNKEPGENDILIAAQYDSFDKMVRADVFNDISGSDFEFTVNNDDVTSIKLFVWRITDLYPLSDTYEIK